MHFVRVIVCFVLVTFLASSPVTADSFIVKSKRLTVLGTLTQEVAVGTKTAWSIRLNPVIIVHGRQISSLEIKSSDSRKLASLEDKFVQAKGKLTFASGIETAQRPVFQLSSIKEKKEGHLVRCLRKLRLA